MLSKSKSLAIVSLALGCLHGSSAWATQEFIKDRATEADPAAEAGDLYLDSLYYEQRIFSSGAGAEIGEGADIEADFRYHPLKSTFLNLGLDINPRKSNLENKTSSLEVIAGHSTDTLDFQGDLDIRLDDFGRGATTLGVDTDSKNSFVRYRGDDLWSLTFFPYNFDGAVGRVFDTGDVTRIYYVDGTPDLITAEAPTGGSIRTKTLPGFGVDFFVDGFNFGLGYGATRYLYPTEDGFSFKENVSSETWESKTDHGYRAHVAFQSATNASRLEFVTHEEDRKTGSMLRRAANLQVAQKVGHLQLYTEWGYTMAGRSAYDIDYDESWFRQTTPFRPIYSDFYGQEQDWLGKEDYSGYLKVGYELDNITPYFSYKSVGEHFVYFDELSANRLRTADGSKSHGGLNVYGIGTTVEVGKFLLTPEIEHMVAGNDVFVSSGKLRSDRQLSELAKSQTALALFITYQH